MKSFKEYLLETELLEDNPSIGDIFELEIAREEIMLESYVVDVVEDGIVIEADDTMMSILRHVGYLEEDSNMPTAQDSTSPIQGKNIYKITNKETSLDDDLEESANIIYYVTVEKPGTEVLEISALTPLDAKEQAERDGYRVLKVQDSADLDEAKYQGREVPLGKPMKGDVKKSKVYVKNAKGNVVKVNFGDPNMKIKKANPKRRKSFRARHHCENPGPRTSARYWSCRAW